MSKSPLRVVFDTNVFAPGKFELLENGPLPSLCASGRIVLVYGHVFLEETLRAYGVENKRVDLVQRWLPFIAKTADRLCTDFATLWHRELVQGHGAKTNIFLSGRDQERVLGRIDAIPLDGSWHIFPETQKARDVDNAKRAAQREISKGVRQEMANWRRAVDYNPRRHGVVHLASFFEREVDFAGRAFIPPNVKCSDPQAVADRWSRGKATYPYFTSFAKNMVYAAHYAATRPNDPIDLNAQADLDLMTHLIHSDALVSNETGFLRTAFNDLWRPLGKVLFTSEEFAAFLALM
jgi:hypothetical protein